MNDHADYLDGIGALPRNAGAASYVLGFILSIALTLGAYWLATHHAFSTEPLMAALALLALLQFAAQAACFLHFGPHMSRARALLFFLAAGIVVILVAGSVWIMNSLNGRMMPNTAQMEQYMQDQSGF